MEMVDYSVYEEQICKLVDKQVIGKEVCDLLGVYLVYELGKVEDLQDWMEEKICNEIDLIKMCLCKIIEQELVEDFYVQKVFGELLWLVIVEVEVMFDYLFK